MKRRTFLLGSSALFASGAFATGTGAFSSGELDRDADVAVVGDDEAYLALTTEDGEPTVGLYSAEGPFQVPKPITIANQLDQAIAITIESPDPITLDGEEDVAFDLDVGEDNVVVVDLTDNEPIEATLEISADGDGVQIEATRTIDLEPLFDVHEVFFRGAGGVDIRATTTAPYRIEYWVATEIDSPGNGGNSENGGTNGNGGGLPPGEITQLENLSKSGLDGNGSTEKLRGAGDGGPGYVAVYVPEIETSYYHPRFDPETREIENWGSGSGIEEDGQVL